MTHYVCTGGCEGVAETPGVCQTEGCTKHEKPLIECHCQDGQHNEVRNQVSTDEQKIDE